MNSLSKKELMNQIVKIKKEVMLLRVELIQEKKKSLDLMKYETIIEDKISLCDGELGTFIINMLEDIPDQDLQSLSGIGDTIEFLKENFDIKDENE